MPIMLPMISLNCKFLDCVYKKIQTLCSNNLNFFQIPTFPLVCRNIFQGFNDGSGFDCIRIIIFFT